MLHSIPEICQALDKTRSEIYAMLNNGQMSYVVGPDGKRRVDTAELQRLFPELEVKKLVPEEALENFVSDTGTPGSAKVSAASVTASSVPPAAIDDKADVSQKTTYATNTTPDIKPEKQQSQVQEIYELRGMITDLRGEINNVLEDNRRLLRLLEHQTLRHDNQPEQDAEPPATEMARQGWKRYKKMRAEASHEDAQPTDTGSSTSYSDNADKNSGWLGTIKRFFFKY